MNPTRRAQVLVVEDQAENREFLRELLERHGYGVETASNGFDALSKLEGSGAPDLILLDLTMPVMNGWTFREALLRDPRWAKVPVVIISAMSGSDPPNVQGKVQKPFDSTHLLETLRKFVP